MIKQVHTWRNAVVEVNRAIRSGRQACMWVENGSVMVSDQPNLKTKFEFVTFSETNEKTLKSDILDRLSRALVIYDYDVVLDILLMLKLIEQWECSKWD